MLRAGHPACVGWVETRQDDGHSELLFATVQKLTVLTIVIALGLAFAGAADAAPVPQQQGSNCDSNYEGPCVPIARDVDCEGGSGDGPEYVSGPVYVVGNDIYRLDNNNDGVGCES